MMEDTFCANEGRKATEGAELSGSSDRPGVRHAPMKQKGGESDKEGQKKR